MTASVKPIRPVREACASVCVFVRLNCGVRPRSFPRTIDLPTSPHPAFYTQLLAMVLVHDDKVTKRSDPGEYMGNL